MHQFQYLKPQTVAADVRILTQAENQVTNFFEAAYMPFLILYFSFSNLLYVNRGLRYKYEH